MPNQNKTALIIGAGIAGPVMALQLQKIGVVSTVFEARSVDEQRDGAFMGITPNGLNILKEFIDIQTLKTDYTPAKMRFFNAKSKEIAVLDDAYQLEKYGAQTIQIKRADLNDCLQKKALQSGIPLLFSKKLIAVKEENRRVTATFEDGSQAEADFLIGCDGTFSTVRKLLFPEASQAQYTKMISTGGYAQVPGLEPEFGAIRMTFGERAFFAYAVSNLGEIWWFNNYFREKEPEHGDLQSSLKEEIRAHLLQLHANDHPVFSEILRASTDIFAYPIYDLPDLASWSKGAVCLIGDAAHATSPHIGQGASLALEDTAVLAKLLRETDDLPAAFLKFQQVRQPRVQKIVRSARKIGENKSKPNRIGNWFRDKLIGIFIQGEMKKVDWVYGYRV